MDAPYENKNRSNETNTLNSAEGSQRLSGVNDDQQAVSLTEPSVSLQAERGLQKYNGVLCARRDGGGIVLRGKWTSIEEGEVYTYEHRREQELDEARMI